jgi:tRNA uridine 5-carbamoylmethylation protein Kti12
MTIVVICVIGLPGAGKTTICRKLCEAHSFLKALSGDLGYQKVMVKHISFDELEIHQRPFPKVFDRIAWRSSRARVYESVQALRQESESSRNQLTILLLDDNFYYKSMRKRYKPDGIIYIDRTINECIALNEVREYSVPPGIIESMALLFEPPDEMMGVPTLRVSPLTHSSSDDEVRTVVEANIFWTDAILHARTVGTAAQAVQHSLSHKALNECESQLRKCVSNICRMKQIPPEIIKRISALKAEALSRFKTEIPEMLTDEAMSETMQEVVLEFNYELASL